jgi:hypothetical protein
MKPFSFLLITMCALIAAVVVVVFTPHLTPRVVKLKSIPAFYSGGLKQGSGGQLANNWDSYNADNLFTPSQAQNSANSLLANSAYPDPASCGSCHQSIYQHWGRSLHAQSATDSLYLKVKERFA